MAMTYTTLTGAKGASGAIATWVNYSKLDIPVVVDEAQSLLYSEGRLRTREMKASGVFTMPQYGSYIALSSISANFLEPIGKVRLTSLNSYVTHKDSAEVEGLRSYTENNGTLGANPFTTTSGSATVSVNLPNHGLTQDSIFNSSGATAFNNVTLNGTFPVNSVTDTNNFTIDITSLGATPNATGSGGGSAVVYVADALTFGSPIFFGIWDERLNFDQSFSQQSLCRLQFYQSLPLLSADNQTNFLTNRYPKLLRIACMAAAAEFMKDDTEYQKWLTRLQSAVEAVSVENDMQYRGMDLSPEIP